MAPPTDGAGLSAAVDLLRHDTGHSRTVVMVTFGAVVLYSVALTLIRWGSDALESSWISVGMIVALIALAAVPLPLGTSILCLGVALATAVGVYVARHQPEREMLSD